MNFIAKVFLKGFYTLLEKVSSSFDTIRIVEKRNRFAPQVRRSPFHQWYFVDYDLDLWSESTHGTWYLEKEKAESALAKYFKKVEEVKAA